MHNYVIILKHLNYLLNNVKNSSTKMYLFLSKYSSLMIRGVIKSGFKMYLN